MHRYNLLLGVACLSVIAGTLTFVETTGAAPAAEPKRPLVRPRDALYAALVGNQNDLEKSVLGLLRDDAFVPSDIDVAKAVELLPSLRKQELEVAVIVMLHRVPSKVARWTDVLVDRVINPGPNARTDRTLYFDLFMKIASVDSGCGLMSKCLDRLWSASDLETARMWGDMASEGELRGWQEGFHSWRANLSPADREKYAAFIAKLKAREASQREKQLRGD